MDPKIYDILERALEEVRDQCGLKIQSIDVQWMGTLGTLSERDMSHHVVEININGLA